MTTYDDTPYPSYTYSFSHPDHLAAQAILLGLDPAPVEHCRVLELGCAGGGNLIPMALDLPGSTFVGIDYSGRQIADGLMAVAALGLKNIELRTLNILDVDESLGQFDYIIAHGVYSWVPQPVRDRLMAVCKQNLAPNGVAMVSYNTYPGWYMLRAVREMMQYHTQGVTEPNLRVTQARSLLDFLADAHPPEATATNNSLLGAYRHMLKQEVDRFKLRAGAFLLHDELEETNDPVYFHEFAEHAGRHGLQYLTEAEFSVVFLGNYPQAVQDYLANTAHDIIEVEQYLDFVRNGMFRKTLLVHDDRPVQRSIRPDRLVRLFAASQAVPVSSDPDIASIHTEQFRSKDGATLSIDHPLSKAAMVFLSSIWPQSASLETIVTEACRLLGPAAPPVAQRPRDAYLVAANILQAYVYSSDLAELRARRPTFVSTVSERPLANRWARYLAQENGEISNMRHERVDLDETASFILRHLDGEHDRAALIECLAKPALGGSIRIERNEKPVVDAGELREIVTEEVDHALQSMARMALLVA